MVDYLQLSKEVSYALRHAPWEYELELDENGWVNVEQLLAALRQSHKRDGVLQSDLEQIIATSDKKRFEIKDGKIRALYGHTLANKILREAKEPPEILYHGTAQRFISSIKAEGLVPKGRQYVHMSVDVDTAMEVGKRRDSQPILLKINAKKAWEEGIPFYYGNEKVWLADFVPSKYIDGK